MSLPQNTGKMKSSVSPSWYFTLIEKYIEISDNAIKYLTICATSFIIPFPHGTIPMPFTGEFRVFLSLTEK